MDLDSMSKFRESRHHRAIGSNFANTRQTSNPTTLLIDTTIVQLFNVSFSVKPLSLPTTQKPLSFIHESIIAPKPIDKKM